MVTTNPYLQRRWPWPVEKTQQQDTQQKNVAAQITTMGLQSQLRNGSIKACKKAATRAKHTKKALAQQGIDGSKPFNQYEDCKLCNAHKRIRQGEKINEPHSGHHKSCPLKPINKKGGANAAYFSSEMERNRQANNVPPRLINASQARLFGQDLRAMFQKTPPSTATAITTADVDKPQSTSAADKQSRLKNSKFNEDKTYLILKKKLKKVTWVLKCVYI